MTPKKLLLAVVFLLVVGTTAQANPSYTGWYRATGPRGQYYYSHYYYAPNRYHHAYYYPYKSRRYVYYYNWQKKRYWGRYDLESGRYSLLPDHLRKENLEEINEDDFPKPPQPLNEITIPGSTETMTAPPPVP